MFRSPISPASFCTSARSSSRSATSSGESGAALEIFFPGILTPNHQSNAKTAVTAMVMRRALKRIPETLLRRRRRRATGFPKLRSTLRDFPAEAQRAQNEKKVRHQNQNEKIRPVFKEICAA